MKKALSDIFASTRPFRTVLAIVVLLFALFAVWQPGFRTVLNVQNVLASISILWIVAMGMTFVLVSGGFDLSVGAIAALCGIFLGKVLEAHLLPGPVAVAATIIVGAVLGGLLNGLFVAVFRLSVFVVTLASMTALTGIVLIWTNTQSIYVTNPVVNQISISRLLGVQTPIYIMIIVFAIFLYVQRRTYFGRDIYATGGSYTAARLSGVRTERTLIMVYAVAGACAGLAGAIAVGRVGAAVPQVDPGLALQAVAAVLIGGTALTGGAGSVVGTAFGCLFIGILQNGLNMVGVASSWQYVVTGIILLASVLGGRVGGKRGGMLTWLKKALGFRAPPPAASCEVEPAGDAASRGGESG
ncbi:MAG: ABC transporter permease [Syntrophorhabdales bacterium]|jgi:ribose/xylose/arabinose/galactoside ABC-type transport system permease subunit